MHGIFLDKTLWVDCASELVGHRRLYIDMPAHGQSSDVGRPWNLEECVTMLIQILDTLDVDSCIALGHSWGGMTALRAAAEYPERFQALGLFNMPFKPVTGLRKIGFYGQKLMARFQRIYAQQAAQSMYSQTCLEAHPELIRGMKERLAARPAREIAQVIDAVICNANDSTFLIQNVSMPTVFVVGKEDFVGIPPGETLIVPGRHISPQEAPQSVSLAIQQLIDRVGSQPPR